jgi:hypothetical protein
LNPNNPAYYKSRGIDRDENDIVNGETDNRANLMNPAYKSRGVDRDENGN